MPMLAKGEENLEISVNESILLGKFRAILPRRVDWSRENAGLLRRFSARGAR
jgi:hypothetical protein